MRILLVIKGENSREFSRHFVSSLMHSGLVTHSRYNHVYRIRGYSENAWLDILVSCAHILNLVFTLASLSDHGDANWKVGRFWDRCFTKQDADSEEAALIFDNGRTRSHEVMRMAVMPSRLCIREGWRHWCVVGCRAGLAPKSCRRWWRSISLMPPSNAASERPFSMGNDIGKEHCFELARDTIQF